VPALVEALQDQSAALREAAARSLGRIGPHAKPAVPELMRLGQDNEESVRAAAKEALDKIEPPATADQPKASK
jgi:HEAT repeat protein